MIKYLFGNVLLLFLRCSGRLLGFSVGFLLRSSLGVIILAPLVLLFLLLLFLFVISSIITAAFVLLGLFLSLRLFLGFRGLFLLSLFLFLLGCLPRLFQLLQPVDSHHMNSNE